MIIEYEAKMKVDAIIEFDLGSMQDRGAGYFEGCRYTAHVDSIEDGTVNHGMIQIHGDSKELLEAIVNKIVEDFS